MFDSKQIVEELTKQSTVIILSGALDITYNVLYHRAPLDMITIKEGVVVAGIVAGAVVVGEVTGASSKLFLN